MAENNDYILQLIRENHLVSDDQIAEGWATVAQSSSELSIILPKQENKKTNRRCRKKEENHG